MMSPSTAPATPGPTRPLRAATPGDIAAAERLLAELHLPTAGVAEVLTACPAGFILADDAEWPGELGAFAGLDVRGRFALLRSVAVRPAWRGRGVGEALVGRLITEARARGFEALYLLTISAERYFPRFGFARVERGAVPPEVAATLEFTSACPASAVAMVKTLTTSAEIQSSGK